MRTFVAMNPDTKTRVSFAASHIPFRDTGYFSGLVLDYIEQSEKLKPFYHRFPDLENFSAQAEEKASNYKHRKVLVAALERQYQKAKLKSASIQVLSAENAFTITTGHQVCLFTGPVYFIYKIVTAIKTCKMLAVRYPELKFIPVFWMATEDHDFEEANHFYLQGKKVEWESGMPGAVGRMNTDGLDEVAAELEALLGVGYNAAELAKLFKDAYLKHETIADATRNLVHQLFSAYGLICIDGDDSELKALAAPVFRKEILESIAMPQVEASSAALARSYNVQAHPRAINLFYLEHELRERIVKTDDGSFDVLNSSLHFSAAEIENLLTNHPECFSPNVILRPLYQEVILPNLAYIGGGGELAYWFQLKSMFAAFEVPFPMLMLRNSVLIVPAKESVKMKTIGLTKSDLFRPVTSLESEMLKNASAEVLQLDDERDAYASIFAKMRAKLGRIDPTLEKSAMSAASRFEHILDNLEKKMMRAERKKQEVLVDRLHSWHAALFPGEGLQERRANMADFYMPFGKSFIDELLEHLNPFDKRFTILWEESTEI